MKTLKLLVDTNIIVDFFEDRPPHVESTNLLMSLGAIGEFDLWISSSQFTDAFYLLSAGGKASLVKLTKERLRHIRNYVRVCALGESEIDAALDSPWEDVEDACIYQCALKVKADAIITRNKSDFARSSLKVFDCEELFEYLEKKHGISYAELMLED